MYRTKAHNPYYFVTKTRNSQKIDWINSISYVERWLLEKKWTQWGSPIGSATSHINKSRHSHKKKQKRAGVVEKNLGKGAERHQRTDDPAERVVTKIVPGMARGETDRNVVSRNTPETSGGKIWGRLMSSTGNRLETRKIIEKILVSKITPEQDRSVRFCGRRHRSVTNNYNSNRKILMGRSYCDRP